MEKNNYGLLIASIVAIVAIVGLVILFSGKGSTGAIEICGVGEQYMLVQEESGQFSKVCVPQYPVVSSFGPTGSQSGEPVQGMTADERSFINWCSSFPDVCCKAYPTKCNLYLGK